MAENGTPKGLGVDVLAYVLERDIKRWFTICIILIILCFGSNLGWYIWASQYTTEVVTIDAEQEAEGSGTNYIIGGDYGDTTKSPNNQKETSP